MTDTAEKFDYSKTLYLPQTDFPMRAGLPEKEPQIVARWQEMDLYKLQREDAKGRPLYVLHDGPPYANGNIHIGHALNKVLKDMVTRTQQMLDSTPITCRAGTATACRSNGRSRSSIAPRARTRNFATAGSTPSARSAASSHSTGSTCSARNSSVSASSATGNPYTTMTSGRGAIAGELHEVRDERPALSRLQARHVVGGGATALAEAEIEYQDYTSDTIWVKFELRARGIDTALPFTVGDDGYYTKDAPGFGPDREGGPARVIDDNGKKGDANKAVMDELIARNMLFARGRLKHQYPHSWRSKKPIIFRNTPQWFVHMDKELSDKTTLRSRALAAIDATRFVPPAGQTRLRSMIEERPDWVLSRQRAWGVPIAVFADADGNVLKDPAVNARIVEAFEKDGADAWFDEDAKARFLGAEHDHAKWNKVTDILDVWFDSGSTHTFTLEDRPDLKWPADVYLEGSDQHRGWFHSSLLESCGTRGRAPYDTVVTHGFTMAEDGKKMSKSLNNSVSPQDVIKQSGADILRLWVATTDYWEDQRLGKTIIQTNVDAYRKFRNTIRWMLGTLAHDDGAQVALKDMPEIERLMLHRLSELDEVVRSGYDAFDFKRITRALLDFMNVELSAFYFDIRKDALYCDAPSSTRRRASVQVVRYLFEALVKWWAPLLPFTTEEAWLDRQPDARSLHLTQFPKVPADWRDDLLDAKWEKIKAVRSVVTGALELERANKSIGSSLEAAPLVYIAEKALADLVGTVDMAEIAITSTLDVFTDAASSDAFTLREVPGVAVVVRKSADLGLIKCARSWRYTDDVGSDPAFPDVSARDARALYELQALGRL
jgi:isoleucyl-tRNA synthetase